MTKKLATKLKKWKARFRQWWSSMARSPIFLLTGRGRPPSLDSSKSAKQKIRTNIIANLSPREAREDKYTKAILMRRLSTSYPRCPKTTPTIPARMKVLHWSRSRNILTSKIPKWNNFLRSFVKPMKVSKDRRLKWLWKKQKLDWMSSSRKRDP